MADHFPNVTKKVDFIRRDEFAKHLADIQLGEAPTGRTGENIDYQNGVCAGFDMAYVALKQFPSADVAEVVRCKDCINWNGNDCITIFGLYAPRPDDYCSRGEKNSG